MFVYPNANSKLSSRISGPLLDRFDMHIEAPRLNYLELRITLISSLQVRSGSE
jgi:predicted ATPase with chaperone activity